MASGIPSDSAPHVPSGDAISSGFRMTGATTTIPASASTGPGGTRDITMTPAGSMGAGVTVTPQAVVHPDSTAPVLVSVVPSTAPAGTLVTINGSSLTGVTAVKFGSSSATFTVVNDSQINAVVPAGFGSVLLTVTGPGGTSNGLLFTYGAIVVPVISSLSPSTGAVGTSVTISGSGFTGATAVKFGTTSAFYSVVSDGQINTVVPAGSGTVQVTVVGPGGTSNGAPFTYGPVGVPVVSGLSPSSGVAGTSVTISGSGFSGASAVMFGSVPSTFSVITDSQIHAVAPAGSGTVQVTVVGPGGTSNSASFVYLAVQPPLINLVTPNQGPVTGGNTVTIVGTSFANATSVRFGNRLATILTNTGTQMTVQAPAGVASEADVTVTTAGGTSNPAAYFYISAPSVSVLAPAMGPAIGGNTVTIFGINLALTTAVHFAGAPATTFQVVSDNVITAQAPTGSGAVLVTVDTPGGTSGAGPGSAYYTYVAAPLINSLTPNQGLVSGGDDVLITGNNLTYTDQVLFGSTPAAFAAISGTQLVVTSPPGTGTGTVLVTVHSVGGTSNALPFQYI